jgi:hypothetical protein
MATTATYSTPSSGIITRLHDGLIAQPISKLICSADAWWHNFRITAPERTNRPHFDKLAIGLPRSGQNRFASLKFFHRLTESISISVDPNCIANVTMYQNVGTLTDCPPSFSYLSRIEYLWRYKSLKYLEAMYELIDAFIPEVKKPARRRKKSWLHWLGAATLEDTRILEKNLQTLKIATEAGFKKFASSVQFETQLLQLIAGQLPRTLLRQKCCKTSRKIYQHFYRDMTFHCICQIDQFSICTKTQISFHRGGTTK